jgi:putative nucleotidyltransferase with HDIG domain
MERACVLARLPDGTDRVAAVATAGLPADLVGRCYPAKSGLAGLTTRSGRPVLISDVRSRPGPPAPFAEGDVNLVAAAPLAGRFGPAGALAVGSNSERREFGLSELELLCELAGLVSDAVRRHAQRVRGPSDSQAEVQGLVKAFGEASGGTWGHSLQVAELATQVGKRLALEPCDLIELELAALLHDVGKLRLPPEILNKPAPLGDEEWRLVSLHPEWGAEMVSRIPGLEAVALIIRLHHERPDGKGYPHGLTEARIPVASRIVSVCDAFSAMTTDRPYRPALDFDAARGELREGAGSQFDPAVVEALGAVVGLKAKAAA